MSDPLPGVLSDADLERYRDHFGVGEEQVRRDHVISHSLAALAELGPEQLIFFGGTALSRTHLADLRLSEDIDLIAIGDRGTVARAVQSVLKRRLRRAFGSLEFTPAVDGTRDSAPSVMRVGEVAIQIQLLSGAGYPAWPTELAQVEQRYRDAPHARLQVLTPSAFAAAKLSAWHDRHAPRDLYDLWGLATRGFIDDVASRLFARLGPITDATRVDFHEVPSAGEWNAALAHQCRVQVDPVKAAEVVRDAWWRTRP